MANVLVVGFDGLDYKLIEDYKCTSVKQKEYGTIDNSTGIRSIVTSELFASFITGSTFEDHGIVDLGKRRNKRIEQVEKTLNKYRSFRKFKGARTKIYQAIPFVDSRSTYVTQDDLEETTFFEEVHPSKAIDVPTYSRGYNIKMLDLLEQHGVKEARKELERFTGWKKDDLFEALEHNYSLVMAHFHKPDHIHHWYWEVGRDEEVAQMYDEIDNLASDIKRKAQEEGFDTVIFMSDHGVPDVENGGHNRRAFYSCNHELFGNKTPHITDFYDQIIGLASEGSSVTADLRV